MVLQLKIIKYQCKTIYNNNTLVFGKIGLEHSHFLLTKIEHDSIIFPPLLLAYTFDGLDHIRQHNQPNTICYALYTMHYTLYTVHYALFTMHYVLYSIHYALYSMHYILYTMHYALCICIHTYLLFHVEIRRNPMI